MAPPPRQRSKTSGKAVPARGMLSRAMAWWSPLSGRRLTPIVPQESLAGRALIAVLAIMCFLSCLAVGAVSIVLDAAQGWQSEVAREITIQLRPRQGVDIEKDLGVISDIARRTVGIERIRVLTRAENQRLLEPWLGQDIELSALPVPRLIVIETARSLKLDVEKLRQTVQQAVPGAALDDHRLWRQKLSAMTDAVVGLGVGVVILVLVATALSIVFATRGTMAANRDVFEVLQLVGADHRFIAREFQLRFLRFGLEGGLIGGVASLVAFSFAGIIVRSLSDDTGQAQIDLLFGSADLGWRGYLSVVGTVLIVTVLTAMTSRWSVIRHLSGKHRAS